MGDKILIVGGYGQVGKIVSVSLAQRYPKKVLAAGRNLERAQALSRETDSAVLPVQLDLDSLEDPTTLLQDVRLVVSSIERHDNRLVRACLERGIHYVEVATSYETMSRLLDLDPLARRTEAAAITGIGLEPGLSNLLARYLRDRMDRLSIVDIHLMLGLGDTHGVDAIRWMLDYADRDFTVQTPAGPATVKSLSDPATVHFPGDPEPRTTYRFDFADQHVIPETLSADGASTRVCFDSRPATRLVALLKQLGVTSLLRRVDPDTIAKLLTKPMTKVKFGTDAFKVKVEANGTIDYREVTLAASACGRNEASATGAVTSLVAQELYEGHIPAGVHHAEQVVTLEQFLRPLNESGIDFDLPDPQVQP